MKHKANIIDKTMNTARKHHRKKHEQQANSINKTMKEPRQNHRQEKEKQATAIDRTMKKEAKTIDTTIGKTMNNQAKP